MTVERREGVNRWNGWSWMAMTPEPRVAHGVKVYPVSLLHYDDDGVASWVGRYGLAGDLHSVSSTERVEDPPSDRPPSAFVEVSRDEFRACVLGTPGWEAMLPAEVVASLGSF